MNVVKEIHRINEAELQQGIAGTPASWHEQYKNSAWVYVGNLPTNLTEGDVICVLSQFGEVEDINLVREEETGKARGFSFVKYEDARSAVLAVDNLTGSRIGGRSIRVDHVEKYRLPKDLLEKEESSSHTGSGHAYKDKELANDFSIDKGQDLFQVSAEDSQRGSSKQVKEEKMKRKEGRRERRREREERRQEKEEKRRAKRARKARKSVETESKHSFDDNRNRRHRRKEGKKRKTL